MKAYFNIIPLSLFGIILISCQPQKSDPTLIEAQEYHQQAGKIRANLGQKLSNVETEGDSIMQPILQEYKLALEEWDEAWVEVPGFDHDHDHGEEGHDHHHHTPPNLTPKEHLELQKHLLEEIIGLEKSFTDRLWELMN